MEFFRTDELQFVAQESQNEFTVLETTYFPDNKRYVLQEVSVDIDAYTEQKLEEIVDGYYDSLAQVKEEYSDAWKQIVAEIVAEQQQIFEWDKVFDSRKELFEHLKKEYGIESTPEDLMEDDD